MRIHFFEWFKKNMIWWFDCSLFSISRIWFRTIHDFRFDDWQLTEWQWNLNLNQSLFFYLFVSNIEIDELFKKKMIKRKKRRIDTIALNISDFEIFFDFLLLFYHDIRRSIKSNNNFWKCFWHNSTFYAT